VALQKQGESHISFLIVYCNIMFHLIMQRKSGFFDFWVCIWVGHVSSLSFINILKCANWGKTTKIGTEKNTSLFAETNSKYDLSRPYKGNQLTK
jgi:hypothetical protein